MAVYNEIDGPPVDVITDRGFATVVVGNGSGAQQHSEIGFHAENARKDAANARKALGSNTGNDQKSGLNLVDIDKDHYKIAHILERDIFNDLPREVNELIAGALRDDFISLRSLIAVFAAFERTYGMALAAKYPEPKYSGYEEALKAKDGYNKSNALLRKLGMGGSLAKKQPEVRSLYINDGIAHQVYLVTCDLIDRDLKVNQLGENLGGTQVVLDACMRCLQDYLVDTYGGEINLKQLDSTIIERESFRLYFEGKMAESIASEVSDLK